MSLEVMKQALEALEQVKPLYTKQHAIAALRQAIEQAERQQALDKKAENARELGLDYEPVPWIESMTIDSTNELSKPTAPVQEPVAWMSKEDYEDFLDETKITSALVYNYEIDIPLYTTPQPQREWVEVECPLCGEMAVAHTHPNLNKEKNT